MAVEKEEKEQSGMDTSDAEWLLWEKEWVQAEQDLAALQELHEKHTQRHGTLLNELSSEQADVLDRLTKLQKNAKVMKSEALRHKNFRPLQIQACLRKIAAAEMELVKIRQRYPTEARFLLRCLLGDVNVRLPHMSDRFKYKQQYEDFKLQITYVIITGSSLLLALGGISTTLESLFHFLLVWFYFTVSVREHVLIQNGSRIKRWWRIHHYLAIGVSGLLLVWPKREAYRRFHPQFMVFSLFLGLVQLLQYRYQTKVLYKTRALGQSDTMDTTTDLPDVSTWLPVVGVLFIAYVFQLYIANVLRTIYYEVEDSEWQVPVLAVMFLILSVGNIVTTFNVIRAKLMARIQAASPPPKRKEA
eukprot:m.335849 g.335849  ORF g.335849 m.335849 type:complete len:359 (+) comp17693_c0_seq1:123-1199(+)